jgi:Cu+-exporting ATPase
MFATLAAFKICIIKVNGNKTLCYHCGDECPEVILSGDKIFCCSGCKQVYLLLNENGLCTYYNLEKNPGIKAKGKFTDSRFAYLDDEGVIQKLVQFSNEDQTNVVFSLPQMHCSSCVFLLENLHRINEGIISSISDFQKKEVFIVFNPKVISLRRVVELLAFIGYEPDISLNPQTKKPVYNRQQIYKIGVAGFCFSNIMMLSFPEYFSGGNIEQQGLKETFTGIIFALSLPVLFYSASGFFTSAFKALRQRYLNIDAPIALAIVVTFARSYYEIISGTGAGYLDSGTGIVFFMLAGRWFQDKTYDSFSFDRDYRSYFPLGVTIIKEGIEKNIPVTGLQISDRIIIRNSEMIPSDAILLKGDANIDYSFVSGEITPVQKKKGEVLYAGGKQVGSAIELEVIKAPSQSYITRLWNNEIFTNKKNQERSFIHPWSRYFTLALFTIAIITCVYWFLTDTSKVLPAVTAVLIVACPCSLLLSATFTYGNMLRLFGKNKLYLKNAAVIESMAKIDTIVLDKTGTITQHNTSAVRFIGEKLSVQETLLIKNIASHSTHPLSKMIYSSLQPARSLKIEAYKEYAGEGIEAIVDNTTVSMGSSAFISGNKNNNDTGTHVHVMIGGEVRGYYAFNNQYRQGIRDLAQRLGSQQYGLYILSGDNDSEKKRLSEIFPSASGIYFNCSPQHKLDHIFQLQKKNKVLMVGDGLNDAGALMQSDVGIAVSDNASQFSPACDAILDGNNVNLVDRFLAYARSGKRIVTASFILSILYNIIGLSFAVQGTLSPVIAAILMPVSSISIVLLVTLLSSISARMNGLNGK